MNANELRLGNWVNYRSTMGTVFPIQVVVGTIEEAFERPDSGMIKPIPLTEEILLKCGASRSGDSYNINMYSSAFGFLSVDAEDFSFSIYSVENECGVAGNVLNGLHALQNLYFAITGQELKIEL